MMPLTLHILDAPLCVCRYSFAPAVDWSLPLTSLTRTADEWSLVCPETAVPVGAQKTERGWKALRVEGTLDFSLIGILAGLTAALAEKGISVFALSTYDTDYLLVRDLPGACAALRDKGYKIEKSSQTVHDEEEKKP